jgi:hypothetical protein
MASQKGCGISPESVYTGSSDEVDKSTQLFIIAAAELYRFGASFGAGLLGAKLNSLIGAALEVGEG